MNMDFGLIETMRVGMDGSVFLLDRHLRRLYNSARHFGFACDVDSIRSALKEAALSQRPACLRLLLTLEGTWRISFGPLPRADSLKFARLASISVSRDDDFLRHKTTKRAVYEVANIGNDSWTESILSNERGEITESAIANLAIRRLDHWVTPSLECGLLPGTMREELIEMKKVREGIVRVEELVTGEVIRCFNSVRGVFDLRFLSTEAEGQH